MRLLNLRRACRRQFFGIRALLLLFCDTSFMQDRVTINSRGELIIPARMHKALGLKGNDQLIIEAMAEGLFLRPATSLPVEQYTEDRVKEFASDEDAIAKLLDRSASGDAGDMMSGGAR
jgi:AbrB family looped-hinge helix DNA binding protein